MRCILAERELAKESWPKILQHVAYSLNTMPNTGTKFTPFKLMLGVEPKSYFNRDLTSYEEQLTENPQVWCDELSYSIASTNAEANKNLTTYRRDMSETANKHRKNTQIGKGERVFVRNDARTNCLEPQYHGPYPISEARGPNVFIESEGPYRGMVHLDRCKVETPDPTSNSSTKHNTGNKELEIANTPRPQQSNRTESPSVSEIANSPRNNQSSPPEADFTTPYRRRSKRNIRLPIRFRDDNAL